jgi:hypothetical protein
VIIHSEPVLDRNRAVQPEKPASGGGGDAHQASDFGPRPEGKSRRRGRRGGGADEPAPVAAPVPVAEAEAAPVAGAAPAALAAIALVASKTVNDADDWPQVPPAVGNDDPDGPAAAVNGAAPVAVPDTAQAGTAQAGTAQADGAGDAPRLDPGLNGIVQVNGVERVDAVAGSGGTTGTPTRRRSRRAASRPAGPPEGS